MQRPWCAPPGAAPTKHQVKAHTRNTFLKLQRDSPRDSSLVFKNPQLGGDRAVGPQLPPAKPFFGNKVRHKRAHVKPNKSHHRATPPEKKRRRPTSEAQRQTQSTQGWRETTRETRSTPTPPLPHPHPCLRKVPGENLPPPPQEGSREEPRSRSIQVTRAGAPKGPGPLSQA